MFHYFFHLTISFFSHVSLFLSSDHFLLYSCFTTSFIWPFPSLFMFHYFFHLTISFLTDISWFGLNIFHFISSRMKRDWAEQRCHVIALSHFMISFIWWFPSSFMLYNFCHLTNSFFTHMSLFHTSDHFLLYSCFSICLPSVTEIGQVEDSSAQDNQHQITFTLQTFIISSFIPVSQSLFPVFHVSQFCFCSICVFQSLFHYISRSLFSFIHISYRLFSLDSCFSVSLSFIHVS